jgi:hypothetical protein
LKSDLEAGPKSNTDSEPKIEQENKRQSEGKDETEGDLKNDIKHDSRTEQKTERHTQPVSEAKEEPETEKQDESRDLWGTAYAQLNPKEQEILLKDDQHHQGKRSKRADGRNEAEIIQLLERVIETTEQQYRTSREKGTDGRKISVRETSVRILNAVLSYREVVGAATALDPTGLATKVWKLVSQGLLVRRLATSLVLDMTDMKPNYIDGQELLRSAR